jgi:hypothetical protein
VLSDYIAEPEEHNVQGLLETKLQNKPYDPFTMCGGYKYIQCGMKKKGMKTYSDNVVMEGNTVLHIPSYKYRYGVQYLVVSRADDLALG